MSQHSIRVPGRVPTLAGQRWLEVAPYLEEFLKRLTEANDVSQTSLYTLSAPVEATDPPYRPRPPLAHRHLSEHIEGLEPPFRPRPPLAHQHHAAEVFDLEAPFKPRPPTPHTHLVSDVIGAGSGSSDPLTLTPPHVHVHRYEEILGTPAAASAQDPFMLNIRQKPAPHTHNGVDLEDVLVLENTGSPGAALLLGDFILASQIFGG